MKPPHKDWSMSRTQARIERFIRRTKQNKVSLHEAAKYADHIKNAVALTSGVRLDLLILRFAATLDGAPFGWCAFRCLECGGTMMHTIEDAPTDESLLLCKTCGYEHGTLAGVKAYQNLLLRDELEFGDGERYRPTAKALALLDEATAAKLKAEGSWPVLA